MTTLDNRPDQQAIDPHRAGVGPVPDHPQATLASLPKVAAPAGSDPRPDHSSVDTHPVGVGAGTNHPQAKAQSTPIARPPAGSDSRPDQATGDTHGANVGAVPLHPQAIADSTPTVDPPAGSFSDRDQSPHDTQGTTVAVGSNPPASHHLDDAQDRRAGGGSVGDGSTATTNAPTPTLSASLLDPFLALAADVVDDAERNRIANENRLRQLTRTATDKDGEDRGFGLDESHPDVANLAVLVDLLKQVERQAALQLQRKIRAHPLGAWCKAQRGIGDKQAARLLAVIGDPYWHSLYGRPRTVSELWAYCGYHLVVPASHSTVDTHARRAGGDSTSSGGDPGQPGRDPHAHTAGVAARRTKGHRSNWSSVAKSRAYLIAESCMKAGDNPYRDVYDKRKSNTDGRTHAATCVRCGPAGKPAVAGTPWSAGHRNADALRITAKTILRDLWREANRIHHLTPSPGALPPSQGAPGEGSNQIARGHTKGKPR